MKEIIYFILTFLIIYLIYYVASIRKVKKNKKKIPVEVEYLILCYHIDTKKIPYLNFMNTIAIVGSFDIALVATLVSLIDGIIWQLLFGFVFVVPVIIISFMLVGKYYKNYQEHHIVEEKTELKEKKKNKKKKENKK